MRLPSSRSLRRRFPGWRFTLVSASLLATMVLAAVGAYALHDALGEHERSVQRALDDYARYGARTFGDQIMRVAGEIRLRATAPVLANPAPAAGPGMALEPFEAYARVVLEEAGLGGDPMRGYFRLDPATGEFQATGSLRDPEVARALRATVRARLPHLRRAQEPALGYFYAGPDSAGFSTVWARQLTPERRTAAILGYVSSRDLGTRVVAARVLLTIPLLPPSFISPGFHHDRDLAHSDSALSVVMLDKRGKILYRSPQQYASSVRGEYAFHTNPGGFVVRATLRPEVVAAIRRAHRHEERRLYVLVLPLLSIALGASAIAHLSRERQLSRAERTFVASVSHELRTPLAQIRMFGETLLLRRERGEEERIRWLGVITREARRLGDLVENILAFAHLAGPGLALSREPTDLGEMVEDVASTYAHFAAGRGVRIEAHAPSGLVARADPRALRQVLVNLLDNALKYGPEGQTVRLSVLRGADGRAAVLSVSDQGPGVPAHERKRLWEPFVRLTGEGGSAGGSGLGLAVVRSIVEQHEGRAWVEDAPGGGARFVVSLPLANPTLTAAGEMDDPVPAGFSL